MGDPYRIYFWRVRNPVTGRWHKTWWRATEEMIREEHPEAERIESDWIEIDPGRGPQVTGIVRSLP